MSIIVHSFLSQIDANKKRYIDRLGESIAIKSVSATAEHRDEVVRMVSWTKQVVCFC